MARSLLRALPLQERRPLVGTILNTKAMERATAQVRRAGVKYETLVNMHRRAILREVARELRCDPPRYDPFVPPSDDSA